MGFGAGSLVFTGLQIGAEIASGPFRAITPGARLLLVTAQMHFIFLNSKSLSLAKHTALAKLGLMHMIATNLCEWLQVSGTTVMKWMRERERSKNNKKIKREETFFLIEEIAENCLNNLIHFIHRRCAFARKSESKTNYPAPPIFESSESICRIIIIVIIVIAISNINTYENNRTIYKTEIE